MFSYTCIFCFFDITIYYAFWASKDRYAALNELYNTKLVYYVKYVSRAGGLRSKNSDVMLPYKHVIAFLSMTATTYILPTLFWKSLRFFLKSLNLKELMTSPNNHSTELLTALIFVLYSSIFGVRMPCLKGP